MVGVHTCTQCKGESNEYICFILVVIKTHLEGSTGWCLHNSATLCFDHSMNFIMKMAHATHYYGHLVAWLNCTHLWSSSVTR